jgi:tRNA-specific 2-thiouridylase
MARLLAAMSGGVDSSVAAALAIDAGHEVVGATLKQWEFGDEEVRLTKGCNTLDAVDDARRAADVLQIPHYTFDFRETFAREVIEPFVDDYANGLTPNPCVRCNERVRFGELADKAEMLGFDGVITGHYARIAGAGGPGVSPGEKRLFRARNRDKDQSYVLYAIGRKGLDRAHFPLGEVASKSDVRDMARSFGLPNADREDSLEVCFVGEGKRPGDVVAERIPVAVRSGPIVDARGEVVGEHRGLAYYTVGQRRGLGGDGMRRYVTQIDAARNAIVVDESPHTSAELEATRARFFGEPPVDGTTLGAVVRYRAEPVPSVFRRSAEGFSLGFERGVRAVSPGQAVVLYDGDEVIGGGTIVRSA